MRTGKFGIFYLILTCFLLNAINCGSGDTEEDCSMDTDCYKGTDCCGLATYFSAAYNGQDYEPEYPAKDRRLCYTDTASTYEYEDVYGVTTTFDFECNESATYNYKTPLVAILGLVACSWM